MVQESGSTSVIITSNHHHSLHKRESQGTRLPPVCLLRESLKVTRVYHDTYTLSNTPPTTLVTNVARRAILISSSVFLSLSLFLFRCSLSLSFSSTLSYLSSREDSNSRQRFSLFSSCDQRHYPGLFTRAYVLINTIRLVF